MRFLFPDSQDQIDPYFNFETETTAEFRVRQRDDRYAHEVLVPPPYDGLLVSKPIVDGLAGASSGKYTLAQRHRLHRLGVHAFFRLEQAGRPLLAMGDCGSFTYVREEEPPYSVDEVIGFYEECGFDYGISVDHVVLGWDATNGSPDLGEWRRRQELSLDLAARFLDQHDRRNSAFVPLGAAQGWSPASYAESVARLQEMGYSYIALGGMVPLKTPQILEALEAVRPVLRPDTRLHLLGISRAATLPGLDAYGVTSLDSTSPFRQAFKDDKDNYYWWGRNFAALRVPQVDGNTKLKAAIRAGRVNQDSARRLERRCLEALRRFDRGAERAQNVVEAIHEYGELHGDRVDRRAAAQELLEEAPWKRCDCAICREVAIEVIIFRGTERNKRRGFHNLHVFHAQLAVDDRSPVGVGGRGNG